MPISNRTLPAIEAFAASMGLSAAMAADGSCNFEFERSGVFSIVPAAEGERVILCLTWSARVLDDESALGMLEMAGPDPVLDGYLHVGASPEGDLALAVDYFDGEVSPQSLDRAFRRLSELRGLIR